jgi:NADH-quinone oxidoreductase subunit C
MDSPDQPTPPAGEAPAPGPAASGTTPASAPASPAADQPAPAAPPAEKKPAVAKPAPAVAAKPAAAKAEPKTPPAPPGPPDPPPPGAAAKPGWLEALERAQAEAIVQLSLHVGDWTVITDLAHLRALLEWLRDAPEARFDFCSDLTAVDWLPRSPRFDLVYCLYSTEHRHRVRVKARVADAEAVPTATPVWPAANWFEREIYDMFGIAFTGHPDPRRILMPEEWQGHPQRKDYPLEGPGELMLEDPVDWLKLRNAQREADFE